MANLTNSAKLIEEMEKKVDSSSLATVATSWSYTDLSDKPTIPTVNNSTITVQKNGTDVDSFTTNAAAWKTINIQLTKADVWLWSVDNTSDANKPVSLATWTELNKKANSADVYTQAQTDSAISAAVSSVYKVKWSVNTYADLANISSPATWDVYNVVDTDMNYVWNWTDRDPLGASVDLSNYLAKNNTTAFTPTWNYNPATKLYVDENTIQKSATEPSNPVEWMAWYDTTNGKLKIYNWTEWEEIGSWWSWWDATDIEEVYWLIYLDNKDYDNMFNVKSSLYKVLNSVTEEDELWLTQWDTWSEIVADQTSMNVISHAWSVLTMIWNSTVAMNWILSSNTALTEFANAWNAMEVICSCSLAYDMLTADTSAMSIMLSNQVAIDALLWNPNTKAKTLANQNTLVMIVNTPSIFENMLNYPDVVNAISNSSSAMNALSINDTAIEQAKDNTVLMTKLCNTAAYINAVSDSEFIALLSYPSTLNIITTQTASKNRLASANTDTIVLPAILSYIDEE